MQNQIYQSNPLYMPAPVAVQAASVQAAEPPQADPQTARHTHRTRRHGALYYFLHTPSRYRRDAALMSSFLIIVALTPLYLLSGQLQTSQARGTEGSVMPVAGAAGTATTVAATAPSPARIWPARGVVTTEFGAPDYPYEAHHSGIDIAGPSGQAIVAFAAGTVTQTGALTSGCGQCVFVDHGNGLQSHYSHLSTISVVPGQHVEPGTPLGVQGSTGWSTGPHVHFQIVLNGVNVDPRSYVAGNPAR